MFLYLYYIDKMYNYAEIVQKMNKSLNVIFTLNNIATLINVKKSNAKKIVTRMIAKNYLGTIEKGKYYIPNTQTSSIFNLASKIIIPCYLGTETAFEYYGLSNIIPKIIRVITPKYHHNILTSNGKIVFIKFSKQRFFGYRESRFISIPDIEKAFVDSLYLGEFPFFTDLVNYYKTLISFDDDINYTKLKEYALKMNSKTLINRVGFFLDYVGKEEEADEILKYIYKNKFVPIDNSKMEKFNNKKWMIK